MKKILPAQAFRKLAHLYTEMHDLYQRHAGALGLTCDGCTQNCCTSYFQHHTYIEWAYLVHGLATLPEETRTLYMHKAHDYVRQTTEDLASGQRPARMCPLNNEGRCGLYQYRLMICRLHGVPNRLRYPNGRVADFPGCYRTQKLCAGQPDISVLDRTSLYTRLMELEIQFVGPSRIRNLPRVDLTLAEMIVQGAPLRPAGDCHAS
ncbi:hypothetical protein MASR1M90_11570 [Desulfovibrionales bacterium]